MRRAALAVCFSVIALVALSMCVWAQEGAAAGSAAPESQGVCVNTKGACYFYDDRQLEAWVTIGSDHGLRPGARVAFLRKGEVVAEGEVVTVRRIDCVVRPAEDTPAGTILRGDDVQVLVNGTEDQWRSELSSERTFDMLKSAFFSGVFVYCILL